jgi:hypothetical protein
MRSMLARVVMVLVLLGSLLIAAAAPVSAHCVQTPVGWVNLDPGHFAAAGGHNSAIEHSGGTVGGCPTVTGPELNAPAPPENPG